MEQIVSNGAVSEESLGTWGTGTGSRASGEETEGTQLERDSLTVSEIRRSSEEIANFGG